MEDINTHSFYCFCGHTYRYAIDLEEHRRAQGHLSTHPCTKSCSHIPPRRNGPMKVIRCGICDKLCERDDIFRDHYIATGHLYCIGCDVGFVTVNAFHNHMKAGVHASEFRCCDCNRSFRTANGLESHILQRHFKKKAGKKAKVNSIPNEKGPVEESWKCPDCTKVFKSEADLKNHRESSKHKPLSAIHCPVGKKCIKKVFTSPSALIQHLESGNCDSGLTADAINQLVQAYDTKKYIFKTDDIGPSSTRLSEPAITTPSIPNFSTSSEDDEWGELGLIRTPPSMALDTSSSSWIFANGIYTPLSEGEISIVSSVLVLSKLRCPFCPKTRRAFKTEAALAAHLRSPVHAPKLYTCPIDFPLKGALRAGTKSEDHRELFTSLSALMMHIEAGACKGGKESMKQIMEFVEGYLSQTGLMGLLLSVSS